MKKIEIDIPDDLNNKNSIFSHSLSFLKNIIGNDDSIEGSLRPLGNTQLMSEKNLAGLVSRKLNKPISADQLDNYKRTYTRETGIKIDFIRKYENITDNKVYLKEDIDPLIEYIINKNNEK